MCNVASGTSAQCSAVVEAGALPPAMKLLAAPDSNLREQVLEGGDGEGRM